MIGGKFLKEWQVRDKIIESILSQFAFNHLWLTQTQKIITHRVFENSQMDIRGNTQMDIRGCVWV